MSGGRQTVGRLHGKPRPARFQTDVTTTFSALGSLRRRTYKLTQAPLYKQQERRPRSLPSLLPNPAPLSSLSNIRQLHSLARRGGTDTAMENNLSASRSARRFLEDRVRNDWDWPVVPDVWSQSDEELRGVMSFRERYYGDSSPSGTEDETATSGDPYRFDNPDSIGSAVELKALRRKRRRRAALEEEMKENEGLRMFVERRDAWTGVASVKKYGTVGRSANDQTGPQPIHPVRTSVDLADLSSSNAPTPMSVDSQTSVPTGNPLHGEIITSTESLVPVAPPLLPDNAVRKSITPKAYPDIFNKIVVSSRTPSVPINLADMTKALVAGWKENGEWPPKVAPLDPLAGKKRSALAAVKAENGEPFLAHHPHLQKGVDSVRKMFHLNVQARDGSHSTPGSTNGGG